MKYGRTAMVLLLAVGLAQPAFALRVLRLPWGQMGYNASAVPDATIVTDIDVDTTNRVWFSTSHVGVTALSGTAVAQGFPLTASDNLVANGISSVAFGAADRLVADPPAVEDHFFVGTSANLGGLQYGIFTNTLEIGGDLYDDLFVEDPDAVFVSGLDSDGADSLWAATLAGLVQFELPSRTLLNLFEPVSSTSTLFGSQVEEASGLIQGGAFFTTSEGVSMVGPGGVKDFTVNTSYLTFERVGGMTLDIVDNLWIAERKRDPGTAMRIHKYVGADLADWEEGIQVEPTPDQTLVFDPDPTNPLNAYTGAREIVAIAVNDLTGAVWVATQNPDGDSGSQGGAFFQEPDSGGHYFGTHLCDLGLDWEDPSDDVDGLGNPCASGWHPVPQEPSNVYGSKAINENFGAVMADVAGNIWLGNENGSRLLIARISTLNKSKYLGTSEKAIARVEDDAFLGGSLDIEISVGSATATFTVDDVDASDPSDVADGIFEQRFGFTFGEANLPDPETGELPDPTKIPLFPVTSSATGVDVESAYTFDVADPDEPTRTIFSFATWAEIADFEDDFLIGGPCFFRTLEITP